MPAGNNIGSVSIKVTPDTTGFRAKVLAALAGVDDDIHIKVKMDLDENGIRGKVKAATAGLDDTVKVKLDVDRSVFDRLPKSLPGGGGGSGLGIMGPFVDNLALVAGVAAIAAPALAVITGALAALPAVIAGVAAPIGVVALGLDGIKKAAEVLQAPLKDLKASISGVFEARLTPVFQQLAGVMPKLTGPLQSVANGLSDVAQSFINTISTGPGLANLQGTIGNIAKTISTMAPGVGSLTNGLLGLANNVSAKFPAVGKWFNDSADAFARWVETASKDGSLDRAMETLGSVGKGAFDLLGELGKEGFKFLQDPKFGESMKTFLADMKNFTKDVLPDLKGFFEGLSATFNGLVGIVDKLQSLGQINGKSPFAALNDSLGNADGQGALDKEVKFAGTGMGHTLRDAFKPENLFGPDTGPAFWSKIKEGFDPASLFGGADMTALVDKLKAAINVGNLFGEGVDLAPLTAKLRAAFNPANLFGGFDFSSLFSGVGTAAQNAVAQVRGHFSQIPNVIAGALAGVGGVVAGAFASAVAAVASAGAQMVSAIVSTGAQIVSEVGSWAGKVAGAAASLAGSLAGVGGQMIAGFLGGFRSAAAAAVSEVAGWAAKIAGAARAALGIHSPSKVFTDIGAQTAQGLQNGLEGGFAGVIERAKALSQQLTDAVNSGLSGVDQGLLSDGIKKQLDELELERKQLKVQKDALPKEDKESRKGVQGQLDQLQALKDQLGLQKDQLGFSQQYGNSVEDANKGQEMLGESLNKLVDIGKGFAMANVQQFESDLGISGEGAIPQLASQGLDFLSSTLSGLITNGFGGKGTTIQVNSVDEALAAKTNLDNKKALQFQGR